MATIDTTPDTQPTEGLSGGGLSNASTSQGGVVATGNQSLVFQQPASYTAALGSSQQRTADQMGVTEDMLVENRLANIMQSPVGKIARDVALQYQNSRGMMDSTQALNAITQASIQAGLPIAEADAAKYFQAAQENMAAENVKRSENRAATDTMTSLNMNALNAAAANNAVAANQANSANQSQYAQAQQWQQQFAQNQQQWNAEFAWSQNKDQQALDLQKWEMQINQSKSDAELASNKMAFVQSIASAGLDASSVSRILWAANSVGLISEDEVHSIYAQMQYPVTEAT